MRNHILTRRLWAVTLILGVLGLALASGCGGNKVMGPSSAVPLTLRAGGAGIGAAALATSDVMHGTRCDSVPVTFSKILLVVREVRFRTVENEPGDSLDAQDDDLKSGQLASTDGHDGDGEGDHEGEHDNSVVFRGPFVVDLLTHTADSLDTQLVQPGDYRSVTGHILPLESTDWNASQFTYLVGSTVYMQGTVNGDSAGAFTYTASIRHSFKIKGRFSVVAATPATMFLVFDTSQWLCSGAGSFLDPRDPANDLAIRRAIIRSLRIGMDDNHDGRCDDGMRGE